MKNLLILSLALFSISPAFAEEIEYSTLFPQIINFGNQIQVQINNTTDKNYFCSGSIAMYSTTGTIRNEFYSDFVGAHTFNTRSYFFNGTYPGEMIASTSNSIYCFEN